MPDEVTATTAACKTQGWNCYRNLAYSTGWAAASTGKHESSNYGLVLQARLKHLPAIMQAWSGVRTSWA